MNNLRIDKRHNGVYLTCDRGMVAQMLAGYSQTQEDDARILAAAPDLLAALKFLLKQSTQLSQQITHDGLENCDAIAKARQAIARAEGKD